MSRDRSEAAEGFTLVEFLIVVLILAIVAAIVLVAVSGITDDAQGTACDGARRQIETAVEAYLVQNPDDDLADIDAEADLAPYLSEFPDNYDIAAGEPVPVGACA